MSDDRCKCKDNDGCGALILSAAMLIVLCWGTPDLLDAIIARVMP